MFRRALALLQAGQAADAERAFKEVLRLQLRHAGALNLLAVLMAQLGRFAEAEDYVRRAFKETPKSDATLYNYGHILRSLGRPAEALERFSQALALNSAVPETWNNRGVTFNDLKRYREAAADFDKALSINASYPDALCNKGKALVGLGLHDQALAAYDKALSLNPALAQAWIGRGNVCCELERYGEALAAYDAAVKGDPADAWLGRGNVYASLRQYSDALAAYDQALTSRPGVAEAWVGRGNVYIELKRHEDAFAAYDRALSLMPDLAEAWLGRGNLYSKLNRPDEAEAAYDKAITLNPELASAWVGRGNVYFERLRYDDAEVAYDKAWALKPGLAAASVGRGNIFFERRRYDDAVRAFDAALALDPDLNYVPGVRLHAKQSICDWMAFAAETSHLLTAVRQGKAASPPFPFLSIASSPADQLRCTQLFVADKYPAMPPLWQGERYDHDRIRIAYLSSEFRRHPVGEAMVGVLERHDRSRFETIGVSIGPDDGSEVRGRIIKAVDQFHDIRTKSDLEAAALIRELGVDIAVKLAPNTDGSRLGILALRPAPIQVSSASAWTSGAAYLDYVLADPRALPFSEQPHFSEQIVHLPDSFFPHELTPEISSHTPSRAEVGLPEQAFVFCCFNKSYKLNPQIFDVWMRILRRLDGAVLWLAQDSEQAADNLRREASARDVDPVRLVFASRVSSLNDHLARHRLADLFLDTLPYGAHTTAVDALDAGLPVLTCRGGTFVGRVSASQLHAIGLADLVTADLDEYEAAAVRLAGHPGELQVLRERLAANRLTYPLFDTGRLCRHMEAAYVGMMERHRRGEPPASFAVEPIR
jgi:predicted O-linked N-acetylglucosamine transferase (SPINDLY family)